MSNNNGKIWKILPEISENHQKKFPEYNCIILQLLYNRGLVGKKEIEFFLRPDFSEHNLNPFLFVNMEKVVGLIIGHIKAKNKILIYGDYDADGATAAAVLWETMKALMADAEVYIPDRVTEGYSLNEKAIKEIADLGAKLVITVDCGIRNKQETDYAKNLGLDIIITDHHIPSEEDKDLPDCLIVNPASKNEKYPFKYLAGVGVAFKLAKALISKSRLPDDKKIILEEKVMDLVAIGTVADCVTTLGENRVLIKKGLEVINLKKRKGLDELIRVAQINNIKKIDSWNIGFQIAPRLNAAGRMEHANAAFELLVTEDKNEAGEIALTLNEHNVARQDITEKIRLEVEEQVGPEDKIIIGVCPETVENESWKEGVIGLVAGRIAEKYYRPTLVVTRSGEMLKGSGRSIEEFNIIEAIGDAKEFLDKFGGHPAACGFSLEPKNLDAFTERMKKIAAEQLAGIDLKPKLKIDAKIGLKEISNAFMDDMEKFSPFGQNNDRPRFASFNVDIVDMNTMGLEGQHIKIKVKQDDSGIFQAIGFGQAEKWKDLQIGDRIDIVYYAENNEFNGKSEVQLKIVDIKISKSKV